MNEKQKMALIVTIVIFGAMLLFPPFHLVHANGAAINLGYSFLFSPPLVGGYQFGVLDVGTLFIQWLGVAVISVVVFFILKDS